MYALHLAVLSLRNGDCDGAIVAGGNLILGPDHQIITSKLGAASPTSRCHTFDARANGYSRAEGFGAIYLKRLSSALDDGNPIRAVGMSILDLFVAFEYLDIPYNRDPGPFLRFNLGHVVICRKIN